MLSMMDFQRCGNTFYPIPMAPVPIPKGFQLWGLPPVFPGSVTTKVAFFFGDTGGCYFVNGVPGQFARGSMKKLMIMPLPGIKFLSPSWMFMVTGLKAGKSSIKPCLIPALCRGVFNTGSFSMSGPLIPMLTLLEAASAPLTCEHLEILPTISISLMGTPFKMERQDYTILGWSFDSIQCMTAFTPMAQLIPGMDLWKLGDAFVRAYYLEIDLQPMRSAKIGLADQPYYEKNGCGGSGVGPVAKYKKVTQTTAGKKGSDATAQGSKERGADKANMFWKRRQNWEDDLKGIADNRESSSSASRLSQSDCAPAPGGGARFRTLGGRCVLDKHHEEVRGMADSQGEVARLLEQHRDKVRAWKEGRYHGVHGEADAEAWSDAPEPGAAESSGDVGLIESFSDTFFGPLARLGDADEGESIARQEDAKRFGEGEQATRREQLQLLQTEARRIRLRGSRELAQAVSLDPMADEAAAVKATAGQGQQVDLSRPPLRPAEASPDEQHPSAEPVLPAELRAARMTTGTEIVDALGASSPRELHSAVQVHRALEGAFDVGAFMGKFLPEEEGPPAGRAAGQAGGARQVVAAGSIGDAEIRRLVAASERALARNASASAAAGASGGEDAEPLSARTSSGIAARISFDILGWPNATAARETAIALYRAEHCKHPELLASTGDDRHPALSPEAAAVDCKVALTTAAAAAVQWAMSNRSSTAAGPSQPPNWLSSPEALQAAVSQAGSASLRLPGPLQGRFDRVTNGLWSLPADVRAWLIASSPVTAPHLHSDAERAASLHGDEALHLRDFSKIHTAVAFIESQAFHERRRRERIAHGLEPEERLLPPLPRSATADWQGMGGGVAGAYGRDGPITDEERAGTWEGLQRRRQILTGEASPGELQEDAEAAQAAAEDGSAGAQASDAAEGAWAPHADPYYRALGYGKASCAHKHPEFNPSSRPSERHGLSYTHSGDMIGCTEDGDPVVLPVLLQRDVETADEEAAMIRNMSAIMRHIERVLNVSDATTRLYWRGESEPFVLKETRRWLVRYKRQIEDAQSTAQTHKLLSRRNKEALRAYAMRQTTDPAQLLFGIRTALARMGDGSMLDISAPSDVHGSEAAAALARMMEDGRPMQPELLSPGSDEIGIKPYSERRAGGVHSSWEALEEGLGRPGGAAGSLWAAGGGTYPYVDTTDIKDMEATAAREAAEEAAEAAAEAQLDRRGEALRLLRRLADTADEQRRGRARRREAADEGGGGLTAKLVRGEDGQWRLAGGSGATEMQQEAADEGGTREESQSLLQEVGHGRFRSRLTADEGTLEQVAVLEALERLHTMHVEALDEHVASLQRQLAAAEVELEASAQNGA